MCSERTSNPKRRPGDRAAAILAVCLLAAGTLAGCSAIVTGGAAGTATAGVQYTLTGVAYRTVNADLTTAKRAVAKALRQLGMKPSGPVTTEKGAKLVALTSGLNIHVSLERITSKATKISVDAKAGLIQKDKATAAEILRRTISNLGQKE